MCRRLEVHNALEIIAKTFPIDVDGSFHDKLLSLYYPLHHSRTLVTMHNTIKNKPSVSPRSPRKTESIVTRELHRGSGGHVLFHEVWCMERLSKTQKKKEALSLQALGERLVTLSFEQLKNIDLPMDLLNAVTLAKSLKKHKALVRQMQYIGTLMRKHDPAPIQDALQQREQKRTKVKPHRVT